MKNSLEDFVISAREEFIESGKVDEAFAAGAKEIFEKFGRDESVTDLDFFVMICDLDGADAFAHCFEFRYLHKTADYSEYDGQQEFAPDEDIAWEIFLHSDGEFKCPDERNYECRKIK